MKKFTILLLVAFLGVNVYSFGQAVDDRAVVPVSVTLNSILRLNIESGGNVEFSFNTLNHYRNGIGTLGTAGQYSTQISVASSVNWDLNMGAEDANLLSTDDTTAGAGSMDLGYIVYEVYPTGSEYTANNNITIPSNGTPQALSQSADIIQYNGSTTNAGDVTRNQFRIDWACGLPTSVATNSSGILLGSPLTGGRYSTNVFFTLQPATP